VSPNPPYIIGIYNSHILFLSFFLRSYHNLNKSKHSYMCVWSCAEFSVCWNNRLIECAQIIVWYLYGEINKDTFLSSVIRISLHRITQQRLLDIQSLIIPELQLRICSNVVVVVHSTKRIKHLTSLSISYYFWVSVCFILPV
jgi:hypothetical protein